MYKYGSRTSLEIMYIDHNIIKAQHDLKILFGKNVNISDVHRISPRSSNSQMYSVSHAIGSFRISVGIGVPIVNGKNSGYTFLAFFPQRLDTMRFEFPVTFRVRLIACVFRWLKSWEMEGSLKRLSNLELAHQYRTTLQYWVLHCWYDLDDVVPRGNDSVLQS